MPENDDANAEFASDAFISYANQDTAIAEALCASLERRGIKCWIAPRDVPPGSLYAESIVRAITGAKVLVLVLSQPSVASAHVGKEVERASSKRRPILALRTDAAPLTPALVGANCPKLQRPIIRRWFSRSMRGRCICGRCVPLAGPRLPATRRRHVVDQRGSPARGSAIRSALLSAAAADASRLAGSDDLRNRGSRVGAQIGLEPCGPPLRLGRRMMREGSGGECR